jgi:subtilase family serine protease
MVKLKISVFSAILLMLMVFAMTLPAMALAQTTEWTATPQYHLWTPDISPAQISGYSPSFIQAAYNLPSSGGSGVIAVVDAYNDPNVASDLKTFSTEWGLPAATLMVHEMSSRVASNPSWAVEISLDVEWAHAIAPGATILLVEANSNSLTDLLSAVSYASSYSGVKAVSMSWGGSEFSTETSYDSYFTTPGITYFASSGDTGGAVIWPASSVNVVSVGGTTLTETGGVYTETGWSDSGGGVSAYEAVPAYQSTLGYSYRATPDVSYNANPNTGFAIYDSYGYSGWIVVGGTSCGSPQWAAIQDLGGSVTSSNLYNDYSSPATYVADFRDITTGTAGSNTAGTGYDLVTGLGSPLTTNFAGPATPNFSISSSPASLTIQAGLSGSSTITATSLDGFNSQVTLTVTGPNNWASVPTPITPTGSATLTIIVPSTATAGTYTYTVTGTSGSLTHSTTVTCTVTTPDFSISASPSSLSVRSGSSGTSKITITALNGFTGTVTLSALGGGLTPTLSSSSITGGSGTSTLTITVPSSIRSGTYTVTITGTSGSLSHTATVQVSVSRQFF